MIMRTEKSLQFAYYREELKAMDCNPDIFAQQNQKTKITHTKQNMLTSVSKALRIYMALVIITSSDQYRHDKKF